MRPSNDKDTKFSHNWENKKILWLMYTHKDPVSKYIFLVVTELHVLLFVHRDQVYLVSLRESYRNEIIPYRVRFLTCSLNPQILKGLHRKYWTIHHRVDRWWNERVEKVRACLLCRTHVSDTSCCCSFFFLFFTETNMAIGPSWQRDVCCEGKTQSK